MVGNRRHQEVLQEVLFQYGIWMFFKSKKCYRHRSLALKLQSITDDFLWAVASVYRLTRSQKETNFGQTLPQ